VTNLSLMLDSGSRWAATLFVENLTDELHPVQGNASLATLGYAEIIYARGRNVQASLSYRFRQDPRSRPTRNVVRRQVRRRSPRARPVWRAASSGPGQGGYMLRPGPGLPV
jgi:hypothetical protein